jgi:hypothetical protein
MDDELWCHVPTSWEAVLLSISWYGAYRSFSKTLTLVQMYTRASASDYDDFQAKGWTTKELIPLMKKYVFHIRHLFQTIC